MAHAFLNQHSQNGFVSPSLDRVNEPNESSPNAQKEVPRISEQGEKQEDEGRSRDDLEGSIPRSIDLNVEGHIQGSGLTAAIEDGPSAPIDVPNRSREVPDFALASSNLSESTSRDPPSLQHYVGNREASISFDPRVRIDDGHEANVRGPPPALSIKTRPRGTSLLDAMVQNRSNTRPRSEADSQEYDPHTGDRLDERPTSDRDSRYTNGEPRWPLVQATVDELASHIEQSEQGSSVRSSSSSTLYNELYAHQTRVASSRETISPQLSTSSPIREFPGFGSQEIPRRYPSRSRSYGIEPRPSFTSRSRRSTAASSASPASAFLSRMYPSSPLPNPDDEGQEVGDYVLGRQIGYGGFSVIREAHTMHGSNRIARAVKIVRRNVHGKNESENETLQAEFEHEVEIWRSLSHPHILPLVAVYNHDFATFAFTQLITTGTLFDLVRRNRSGIEPALARRYTAQLTSAIRFLHEDMRIVHRDLKLENCLIDTTATDVFGEGGKLLLCDFGLTDYFTSDSGTAPITMVQTTGTPNHASTLPQTAGQVQDTNNDPRTPPLHAHLLGPSDTSTNFAGSLPYACPEMLEKSSGILSPEVDMWAFGVVCFAIIMGRLPFNHNFAPSLRMKILHGEWDRAGLRAREEGHPNGHLPNGTAHDSNHVEGPEQVNGHGAGPALEGIFDIVDGCLTLDPLERWDIQDVISSSWLGEEYVALGLDD
ncbi:hypothetical protein MMC10_009066 [Thelotrema lepadinum]|nr:hypothetical protein [Thelotrema lepadinum]